VIMIIVMDEHEVGVCFWNGQLQWIGLGRNWVIWLGCVWGLKSELQWKWGGGLSW